MRSFDLIIVGTGSGNSIVSPNYDDWDVAIVERALFGGTCLNVGCIPSKMLVYTAELAEAAGNGGRYGIDTRFVSADWAAIRDRVFGRIDPIAESGEQYRKSLSNATVYGADARFVGPKRLQVGEEVITADKIVLAAGARAFVPDIAGLYESGFHTSDTIMRIEALPKRLTVIGGGYIAAELGNVFGSLGSEVTFLLRGHTMLRSQDAAISECFTKIYADKFDVRTGVNIEEAHRDGSEIVLKTNSGDHRCDELLVATGRVPNGDQLQVAATGVATDDRGYVITDKQLRTNVEGIWALGDVTNPIQLKHVANHEARVVSHNLMHPEDPAEVDHRFIPAAVFGHPQVASVGLTEEQCSRAGLPHRVAVKQYASAAYGWAMEDTESFCKLIVNTETRRLLGAHLLGPQASTLIQQLIQAMVFDLSVDDIAAKQYYIHPALPEVVEQALLEL